MRAIARVVNDADPVASLRAGLGRLLDGRTVSLRASGREALHVAFRSIAERTGRDEVVVPAYTCYSVAASAVRAGLRVRPVDVDADGRIDVGALSSTPLDRVGALVVCNLFGAAEAITDVARLAREAGVSVIDDAAQALGARDAEGRPVGARGDYGILSFSRGKPLGALGGGALVGPVHDVGAEDASIPPRRLLAIGRALAYDLAREPSLFRLLSAIPALGIGETHFELDFETGAIDGASLCLAAAVVGDVQAAAAGRRDQTRALVDAITRQSDWRVLGGTEQDASVMPRLVLAAPSPEARTAALAELRDLGATGFYPASLPELPELAPSLVADAPACPRARALARRVLTLPCLGLARAGTSARVRRVLAALSVSDSR